MLRLGSGRRGQRRISARASQYRRRRDRDWATAADDDEDYPQPRTPADTSGAGIGPPMLTKKKVVGEHGLTVSMPRTMERESIGAGFG